MTDQQEQPTAPVGGNEMPSTTEAVAPPEVIIATPVIVEEPKNEPVVVQAPAPVVPKLPPIDDVDFQKRYSAIKNIIETGK